MNLCGVIPLTFDAPVFRMIRVSSAPSIEAPNSSIPSLKCSPARFLQLMKMETGLAFDELSRPLESEQIQPRL